MSGNTWNRGQGSHHYKAKSFVEIVKEQEVVDDSVIIEECNVHSSEDLNDEQLALAISLSLEQSGVIRDNDSSNDAALALCLQQLEDDECMVQQPSCAEAASRQPHKKISVVHQHMLLDDFSPISQRFSQDKIHSNAWTAAVALEKKALEKGQEKVDIYSRHEPLMQSLQTSQNLTELDGAGDLYGGRILVSKDVGQGFRTFVRKEEKKASTKRYLQSKASMSDAKKKEP